MALWTKRNRAVERAAAEVMRPLPVRWGLMLGLFVIMGVVWWQHFDRRTFPGAPRLIFLEHFAFEIVPFQKRRCRHFT